MKETLDRTRSLRKWLYSPLMLIVLFVFVIISAVGVVRVYIKEQMSHDYLVRTQNDLKKVQDRQVALGDAVKYLKTSQGIDAELRTKFRVVKDGEQVSIIVDPTADIATSTQVAAPISMWSKFKNLFK